MLIQASCSTFGLSPSLTLRPKGAGIIIQPCGPTLSLPHPVTNMVMINHSTSNRNALLPLRSLSPLPWAPDDCLMLGHDTMGSRCVIDGGRTMFISGEALWFRITGVQSHPLARPALWLYEWLMGLYWQWEGTVSGLTQIQNNILCTAHARSNLLMHGYVGTELAG